jgi:hypothetical protein
LFASRLQLHADEWSTVKKKSRPAKEKAGPSAEELGTCLPIVFPILLGHPSLEAFAAVLIVYRRLSCVLSGGCVLICCFACDAAAAAAKGEAVIELGDHWLAVIGKGGEQIRSIQVRRATKNGRGLWQRL